jgi:acetyltransferase-like isoleucine patch superfamily enzyme
MGSRADNIEESVEKSKMLRNEDFNYFDSTLVSERQRCTVALQRYNNACRLASGLSAQAAHELLEMVLKPVKDKVYPLNVPCTQEGVLGDDTIIEAPFTVSYGYNLRVYGGVRIHRCCTIDDAALVEIGPGAYIGPNVTIITSEARHQLRGRKGVAGKWTARPVQIGADACIGANAIICPGVIIGPGATVMAGAVVTEQLTDGP